MCQLLDLCNGYFTAFFPYDIGVITLYNWNEIIITFPAKVKVMRYCMKYGKYQIYIF